MEALDKALKISLELNADPDPAATIENGLIDDLRMKSWRVLKEHWMIKTYYLKIHNSSLKMQKNTLIKSRLLMKQTNSSTQQELIKAENGK